ncbi:MAG: class I SAM-dependent methyltransferase [Beijerinckiaceae bacterium]
MLFQKLGDFIPVRVRSICEYLSIKPGDRIIDIGCGPGYIVNYLPDGVDYHGFDISSRNISYAQKHFGDKGTFHCKIFDDANAREFAGADIVMLMGLLHHLDDQTARAVLQTSREILQPDGIVFTFDGCFRHGQSPIARWLLRNDRGRHVRTKEGYENLCGSVFEKAQIDIRDDLSSLPYTLAIGLLQKR